MLFARALLMVALLHVTSISAWPAESVVNFGSFAITLPDGYTDNSRRGIDSLVGNIRIHGKPFKIDYDTYGWGEGPTKFSGFPKGMLDSTLYYERIQDDPVPTCITVWLDSNGPGKPIVTLWVLGLGALHVHTSDKSDVQDAIATLRAIRITKPPQPKP